jgi:ribonuclease BN (tRNA processing enzyme)
MKLTIAGCGTGLPDGERVCSGYIVEHEDVTILMDCGPGVVHSMARHKLPWSRITHLVLSHFHNDHVGDIPYLFFALKHGLSEKREEPLTVIGPKGTRRLIERMGELFGSHMRDTDFTLRVREIIPVLAPGAGTQPAQSAERHLDLSQSLRVTATRAKHTDEALAYRFEAHGVSLGYTGDTGYDEGVASFLENLDVVIAECSNPDEDPLEIHLSPSQLAQMATLMKPGRLVVTHVEPRLDRNAIPATLKKQGFKGKAIVAEDGMTIEVRS